MRGGKRDGAGRPAKGMTLTSFRLYDEDLDFIRDTAKEKGVARSTFVHELVETYKDVTSGEYERAITEE